MAAAAIVTTTPFTGKHMISSSAVITGWRMTAPMHPAVHAATHDTGSAPVSSEKP